MDLSQFAVAGFAALRSISSAIARGTLKVLGVGRIHLRMFSLMSTDLNGFGLIPWFALLSSSSSSLLRLRVQRLRALTGFRLSRSSGQQDLRADLKV